MKGRKFIHMSYTATIKNRHFDDKKSFMWHLSLFDTACTYVRKEGLTTVDKMERALCLSRYGEPICDLFGLNARDFYTYCEENLDVIKKANEVYASSLHCRAMHYLPSMFAVDGEIVAIVTAAGKGRVFIKRDERFIELMTVNCDDEAWIPLEHIHLELDKLKRKEDLEEDALY